ncbi:MAG: DAK2 domain-containing protein [Bowdeniella nasicola]|nr:DAK2 domain-containing protein [Bowdeniella nasicola]
MHTTETLDASTARRWLAEALRALAAVRTRVDALNVFPVPDADTGTNVVLTVTSGAREAHKLGPDASLPDLTAAVARGALWGARGNSGIIISQAFQAVARTFASVGEARATDLIRALDAIAIAARDAVAEPVDGTIITVSRAVADAVVGMPPDVSLSDVAATAHRSAVDALARTGEQLAAATGRHAAIDAGAASYVVLLDALAEALGVSERPDIPWGPADPDTDDSPCPAPADEGEFEVMYVYRGDRRQARATSAHLREVGHSVAVVAGVDDHWHVHVHLDDPTLALPGRRVEQLLVRHLHNPPSTRGLVATASGPGILEDLARSGAVATMNPRYDTLVRAVIDASSCDVTILPATTELSDLAREVATDAMVAAEGITVRVAPTTCDPHVYATCTEWALAQLVDEDAHPHHIAEECVREVIVHPIMGGTLAEGEAQVSRALASLPHGGEEPATIVTGSATNAEPLASFAEAALRARGREVSRVTCGQERPYLWLMVHREEASEAPR